MFVSPIIERELRVALRRHRAVRSRFYAAAIGAGVVVFFLLIGLAGGSRLVGRQLHSILFYVGLYMAIVPATTISVGLFSEERRNQTMELLYLAGVGPGELFGGKLLGGILAASCNLLALSPFLAVPFLTGGISFDLFLATIACFPALLLMVTSIGVLSSVLCRDDGSAFICAVVIGGILCLATPVPYNMGMMLAGAPPFSAKWLCLSPAYGPYLVAQNFGANRPGVFWLGWGATLGWAVLCVGIAGLLLKRTWRIELERNVDAGRLAGWEALIHGDREWRFELRWRLLATNPFQWLVEQDRRPVAVAWGIVGGVSCIWLAGWCAWPWVWPSPANFYLTAGLLITGMELVMAYAAAQRIGNDRRDGALELLLTTPMSTEEIVDGQCAALKRMFRPVRATVFGICVLMMLGGLLRGGWNTASLVSYVLIWCILLGWCLRSMDRSTALSMWIGANAARPAYAIFRFRRQGPWYWVIMVFNFRNIFRAFGRGSGVHFPTGSPPELIFVGLFSFVMLCVAATAQFSPNKMRQRLIAELRSIAREPLPATQDPRFKKWDVRQRLPRLAYAEMAERVRVYPQRMADAKREGR